MNPPTTYAEWIKILEIFKKPSEHDGFLIQIMEQGQVSWSEGVAERFTEKCTDSLSERLDHINTKFNRDISNIAELDSVANATVTVRRRLELLVQFSTLDSFPQELKTYITENLRNFAESMQNGLVDDLEEKSKFYSRYGEILVYVKKNPITLPDPSKIQSQKALKDERKKMSKEHPTSQDNYSRKKKNLLF